MPRRVIDPVVNYVKRDRALQKTISYRILVAIGGAGIIAITWVLSSNPWITVFGGSAVSEIFRTIVYFAHEKYWEHRKGQELII